LSRKARLEVVEARAASRATRGPVVALATLPHDGRNALPPSYRPGDYPVAILPAESFSECKAALTADVDAYNARFSCP
jgi:hypothetical protein